MLRLRGAAALLRSAAPRAARSADLLAALPRYGCASPAAPSVSVLARRSFATQARCAALRGACDVSRVGRCTAADAQTPTCCAGDRSYIRRVRLRLASRRLRSRRRVRSLSTHPTPQHPEWHRALPHRTHTSGQARRGGDAAVVAGPVQPSSTATSRRFPPATPSARAGLSYFFTPRRAWSCARRMSRLHLSRRRLRILCS
jgi:hypothetical protein